MAASIFKSWLQIHIVRVGLRMLRFAYGYVKSDPVIHQISRDFSLKQIDGEIRTRGYPNM